jgi:DNA-binding beta-propeller fold protein YncE
VGKIYDLFEECNEFTAIAIHGEGKSQRVAVLDGEENHVLMVNAESGKRVATAGECQAFRNRHGEFEILVGVGFSPTGELYVSEEGRIHVFDRKGRYVRCFDGPISWPHGPGLCFTADGNLVVADFKNHRVQVLREDGTLVREFGSAGQGEGEFGDRFDVCGVAADGSIAVLDSRNHRVQVVDGEGGFVRSIGSEGKGPGQFVAPVSVAVGAGGEIIVGDCERQDVQVFSKEGELLQIIGKGGDSDVDLKCISQVCTDASGRLFVLDQNQVMMLC